MAPLLTSLLAAACCLSTASATYLGFNTGAMHPDNSAKVQADFQAEFEAAQNLVNAPGTFNSIRLYTNIQYGTNDTPIEAFPAAIATNTSILLGIWASGTDNIDQELAALKSAIDQYGTQFADLVIAISVGSEDLYRQSVPGLQNNAGVGNTPANIKSFIQQTRNAIADTPLASKPVGHVDTFDQLANDSNSDALSACDFWGLNAFPYYEKDLVNPFSNSTKQFTSDFATASASAKKYNNKPIWVTETGWPWTGPVSGEAVASVENAKGYWDDIGCNMLFGKTNTWWYALVDGNTANVEQFDITANLSTTARFDLTCPPANSTNSSSASNSSSSGSGSGSGSGSSTGSSTGSGSGTGSASASASGKSNSASRSDLPLAAAFVSAIVGAMMLITN